MAEETETPEEEVPAQEAEDTETPSEEAAAPADPTEQRFSQLESSLGQIRDMLGQLSQGGQQARAPAGQSEEERLRLELMDPTERAIHELRQTVGTLANEVRATSAKTADSTDYTAFHARAASGKHPAHTKYADQVEGIVAAARKNGHPVLPREAYLYMLVGKDAVNRASTGAGKKIPRGSDATQAGARVPAKGDAGAPARTKDEREARKARLSNMLV